MVTFVIMTAIFFLIIANVSSHQSKEIQKEVHQSEIRNLEELRNNPILNKNYTKVVDICNKLSRDLPYPTLEVNVAHKYRITRKKSSSIHAQGYFGNNLWLETNWTFNTLDEEIRLYFSCSKAIGDKEKLKKTIIVNDRDTKETIVNKIIELTKTV